MVRGSASQLEKLRSRCSGLEEEMALARLELEEARETVRARQVRRETERSGSRGLLRRLVCSRRSASGRIRCRSCSTEEAVLTAVHWTSVLRYRYSI